MDRDAEGRPRSAGTIRGVTVVVGVAVDEPDPVVTVFRPEALNAALHDSRVNARSIDLLEADARDGSGEIDETYCRMALAGGAPPASSCSTPLATLGSLGAAAERLGLDRQALEAAPRCPLPAAW